MPVVLPWNASKECVNEDCQHRDRFELQDNVVTETAAILPVCHLDLPLWTVPHLILDRTVVAVGCGSCYK